jgi:hypothetical protein
MEDNFFNDELEQFLKSEADSHTMYPSENLWDNIRVKVHGETSWHALTFGTLLILLIVTTITVFNYPPKTIAFKTNAIIQKTESVVENNVSANNTNDHVSFEEQINPVNITNRTIESIQKNLLQNADQDLSSSQKIKDISTVNLPLQIHAIAGKTKGDAKILTANSIQLKDNIASDFNEDSYNAETLSIDKNTKKSRLTNKLLNNLNAGTDEDPTADGLLKEFSYQAPEKPKHKTKFDFQLYVTPSVSFRKLEDDKTRVFYQNAPLNIYSDINNYVHHTPALGFELGAGIAYNLTSNFKIKTGLQFNIRQYYIDAYQSYGIATIAIVQNNHLDSIQMLSMFGNAANNGSSNNLNTKIDNKLYQLSIPLGLQWDIINGKKLGLSISGSIQPTYTLNKNVYMISTDYKYYANGAPFFRKWNVNSSAEINITYQSGNVKWYLGPQVRYQHYPTYNDVYPIKEYRLDYGIKLGLSTPIFK